VSQVSYEDFLEAEVRLRQRKPRSGALDRAFPGRPLIFEINSLFYFEITADRGLPALPF
jgi:hypothetical protein